VSAVCDSRCVAIKSLYQCLPQPSSASRLTAGASGFFILSQSGERPRDTSIRHVRVAALPAALERELPLSPSL
jgi:hypothetical protein